jgi:hypothetical protein
VTAPGVLAALVLLARAAAAPPPDVREGDIVFHTSRSAQSAAIQRVTGSKYSHMGLVLFRDGKPFVFEAVATVKWTPLAGWLARGEGGRYVVKRLKRPAGALSAEELGKLRAAAAAFAGKPYDLTFEWSDARIYCSELVWKVYQRGLGVELGRPQRLRDFRLDDPLVRAKLRERYGAAVPLDEPVVAPGAMFDSELLETIAAR